MKVQKCIPITFVKIKTSYKQLFVAYTYLRNKISRLTSHARLNSSTSTYINILKVDITNQQE